jgi:hypothetical protein
MSEEFVELNITFRILDSVTAWDKFIDFSRISEAIDEVERKNMRVTNINLIWEPQEGIRLFGLPVKFKIMEEDMDKKLPDFVDSKALSSPIEGPHKGISEPKLKIEKPNHILLGEALNKLDIIVDKLENVLDVFTKEESPRPDEEQAYDESDSVVEVLMSAPKYIENKLDELDVLIEKIKHRILYG